MTSPHLRRGAAVVLAVAVAALPAFSQAKRPASKPAVSVSSARPLAGLSAFGPADAPVSILEFTDLGCPFSSSAAPIVRKLAEMYPGKLRLEIKHAPLPIHPQAPLAHEALLAAAAQGKFWPMHDLIFANQKQLERSAYEAYAQRLGLDMARFRRELDAGIYRPVVQQNLAEARALAVESTPTLFINGRRFDGFQKLEALMAAVDEQLAKADKTAAKATALPSANERVTDFDLRNAQVRGAENAPVTIVQFTDFECPFCRMAVAPMDQLMKDYEGQVRWVLKHYPLDFHPNAPLAHEAALAAGEQGKFWEMHDLLFANSRNLKKQDLLGYAEKLGLNVKLFAADLDSGRFKAQVAADRAEGMRAGVSGTPTSFINGRRITGARSVAELKQLVDQELRAIKYGTPAVSQPVARQTVEPTSLVIEGPREAPVTLTWFADASSSLDPRAAGIVRELARTYGERLRVVFKNRPLEQRKGAELVHLALIVAASEGKFWQMHDLVAGASPVPSKDQLVQFSTTLSLDPKLFAQSLEHRDYVEALRKDVAEAQRREVRGTPVFFVNGQRIDGIQPIAMFKAAVEAELKKSEAVSKK